MSIILSCRFNIFNKSYDPKVKQKILTHDYKNLKDVKQELILNEQKLIAEEKELKKERKNLRKELKRQMKHAN